MPPYLGRYIFLILIIALAFAFLVWFIIYIISSRMKLAKAKVENIYEREEIRVDESIEKERKKTEKLRKKTKKK